MQICTNCVMDETDSLISFDSSGVCDHCLRFERVTKPHWNALLDDGHRSLRNIGTNIKKSCKNREFDCLVGMSGGVDSSYLVYVAKELMGLSPLVFHVDAGWNSQIATNNIEKMVDGLGLDLYTEVIDWEEMKDLQLSFLKAGVSNVDAPQDHAFFATMYKFASKYDIKHILTGFNFSTECVRNPVEWMYHQSDSVLLRHIHRKFGRAPLKNFPTTSVLWHKVWLPYVRGIKVLHPLNYVNYQKEEAKNFLQKNFGWEPYTRKHFESRFTSFYESYWLFNRFGFDVRKVQFSSLILTEQMTREHALDELAKLPFDEAEIDHEITFISNKLDIEVSELRALMHIPLRTYRDYKNASMLYDLGSRILGLGSGATGAKR